MCCRFGLSEEFIAVFRMKMSQIDTENYKKAKNSHFSRILCRFFGEVLTEFVDWIVSKGQQGTSWLPSSLL